MEYTGIKCVTLEGEIATSVGVVRGSSAATKEGGAIGKQHQIEELRGRMAELDSRMSSIAAERDAVLAHHDALDLKQHQDAVKTIEKEMHAIEMRIAQVAFEKKRAEESIAASEEQRMKLLAETTSVDSEIADDKPVLGAVRAEQESVEHRLQEARTALERLEQESARRARVVQEVGLELVHLRNDTQATTGNLERATKTLVTIAETFEKHRADAEQTRMAIEAVESGMEGNRHELRTPPSRTRPPGPAQDRG